MICKIANMNFFNKHSEVVLNMSARRTEIWGVPAKTSILSRTGGPSFALCFRLER